MSKKSDKSNYDNKIRRLTAIKLEQEIQKLNQKVWERPTFWLSVSPAILTIVGIIFAWQGDLFENRRRLLEIRKAKLEF